MYNHNQTVLPFRVRQVLYVLVAALLAVVSVTTTAWARVDVCYSGGQFLPNFTLNGNGFLNGSDILVTQAVGAQRTSVMYDTPLSTSSDIHIRFVIRISASGNGGADGMAFVMHNATTGVNTLGTAGGGIGYDGISPAVVVEFDTYTNGWDSNDNHVAITRGIADHSATINNGLPGQITDPPVTLKSGNNIYVWIDYIGSTHSLSVYLSSAETKPGTATLSTTSVNVASVLGSQMYIGFTGSTGGSWNQHEIVKLYASDTGNPGDACCATNSDCAGKSAPLGTVCDPVKKVCGPCSLVDDGTCPQPAGCNVAAALNQCTTECAGDYGSVATGACTASNFKACSVIGSTTGNCVMCNGDYSAGSGYSVRCPSGAPTCLDDGFCGSCTSNSDCTSGNGHAGGVCNTSTGRCGCTSSADCSAASAGPVCSGGICGCSADSQCGAGNFCSNAVCKSKLANGAAIPNDTLHTATCNSTNALAVCQSGECNATTKTCSGPNATTDCTLANQCTTNVCGSNLKCGITNFGDSCSGNAVCQSGICSSGGVCIATNSCWVDADCSDTKHCDRTTRGCVDDLSAGSSLPNDGYHLGTCTDAAAVCASHLCNTAEVTCGNANGVTCALDKQCVVDICGTNLKCGIADYEGTCSTSNASFICQSGACSASAVCMASTACYVDADCSISQYCNRETHGCVSKLLAGADIPTDGLHDGSCSSAAAVCSSGLACNSTQTTCGAVNGTTCSNESQCVANICGNNSKCGYASGTGTCDSTNETTVCQSGKCSASAGFCIPSLNGCGSDDDCGVSDYCDGATFTCQPRLVAGQPIPNDGLHDGSCSAVSRVCVVGLACNASTKTCGSALLQACETASQCAVNICGNNKKCGLGDQQGECSVATETQLCQSGFCGSASNVCVSSSSGCSIDADCPTEQFCDGNTKLCVARLSNGTAIPNDGLHDGTCDASNTSRACATGACNSKTNTCAGVNGTECTTSEECIVDRCGNNKKCGLADGQSGCTLDNGAAVCQSAECAASLTCVPTDGCYEDSDCTTNQFCDRSEFQCKAKLGKGEAIPTDGLHLGLCDEETALAVCQSGQCNATEMTCAEPNGADCGLAAQCVVDICGANNKCGIATASSGCSVSTGSTLCQSATCASSGVCIPTNTFCWMDSDCAPEQFCNRSTNLCVSDLANGSALPVDGLHDGRCSNELATTACTSGHCNAASDTCAGIVGVACLRAEDCERDFCGSNKLCGKASGQGPCSVATKGECQSAECGEKSGLCVPNSNGCAIDADCETGYFCNPVTMECTSRLADGSALPKDSLHNGDCSSELAVLVCTSGMCNAVDNTCGATNGTACSTNEQCQSAVCGSNGQCGRANGEVGCTSVSQNLDCQSANCSVTGACIPAHGCAVSSECAEDQYCDTKTLSCVKKLTEGESLSTGCSEGSAKEFCTSGECNSITNTCATKNGEPCQESKDCKTNQCGSNARCGIAVGDGPCSESTSADCQSGICGNVSGECIPTSTGCNVDADCDAGKYCAVTTRTCETVVEVGTKLPVDEEHDGKCTETLASTVCATKACNASTNTCASANGAECDTASDCVSNVCGSNGRCGLAVGETGCVSANEAETCQSGDCGSNETCIPKDGCLATADCAANQYCDSSTSRCVAKVTTGEPLPTSNAKCTANVAKEVCKSGECNAETNTCAEATGSECDTSAECVTNACGTNGYCAATACTTDECTHEKSSYVGGGGCTIDTTRRSTKTPLFLLSTLLLGYVMRRRRVAIMSAR